jgi:hypothetical protein
MGLKIFFSPTLQVFLLILHCGPFFYIILFFNYNLNSSLIKLGNKIIKLTKIKNKKSNFTVFT